MHASLYRLGAAGKLSAMRFSASNKTFKLECKLDAGKQKQCQSCYKQLPFTALPDKVQQGIFIFFFSRPQLFMTEKAGRQAGILGFHFRHEKGHLGLVSFSCAAFFFREGFHKCFYIQLTADPRPRLRAINAAQWEDLHLKKITPRKYATWPFALNNIAALHWEDLWETPSRREKGSADQTSIRSFKFHSGGEERGLGSRLPGKKTTWQHSSPGDFLLTIRAGKKKKPKQTVRPFISGADTGPCTGRLIHNSQQICVEVDYRLRQQV